MSRLFLKDNGDWHIYDLINFNTSIFTQIYIKMFILDTPDLPLSVKTKDSIAKYRDNSIIQIESRYFLIRITLNAIS